MPHPTPTPAPGRQRFTVLLAAATLLLIIAGGLVTSHGAGMAVPDWPNTYGYNLFYFPFSQWVGGIFYEHTHRQVAAVVGFLTTVLVLWLHGYRARPLMRWGGLTLALLGLLAWLGHRLTPQSAGQIIGTGVVAMAASWFWPMCPPAPVWHRRLGTLAWIAVVLQGVLGGLRVVLMMDGLGIPHAALAQLFFALIAVLALLPTAWWQQLRPQAVAVGPLTRWLPLITTGLIFIQLLLGAAMRHRHAGLAIPDFPTAYGQAWPATDPAAVERYNQERVESRWTNPITAYDVQLQMVHRLTAFVIVGLLTAAAASIWRRLPPGNVFRRATLAWASLGWLQVLLGAATLWTNKSADLATAHVAVGSLLLAGGTVISLCAHRMFSPSPAIPVTSSAAWTPPTAVSAAS